MLLVVVAVEFVAFLPIMNQYFDVAIMTVVRPLVSWDLPTVSYVSND